MDPHVDTAAPGDRPDAVLSYPRFLWRALGVATEGSLAFQAWMVLLTAAMLVGLNAWAWQVAEGMAATSLTDHVSWGMYIGNFTYAVGLAAGAVMMVIPAYLYKDKAMHDVVIVGEILAIAACAVSIGFVTVDVGRPDRLWHMAPGLGRFNWPVSMLTWDVIVLTGYLLINLHVVGYLLYMRYLGREPDRRWYMPFVFLSIVWAVSIHTVTAFLYSGLGGRPFWNTAVLAPRFIASAFVTGPAFIVLALQLARHFGRANVATHAIATLVRILRVTVIVNIFLVAAEAFTEFYTGGSHVASATYLFFGLHGHRELVPWIWSAIAFNVVAAVLFFRSSTRTALWAVDLACVLSLVGIWIEKGMGLIVPAFVPSTLHEVVPYWPNRVEWQVSVGVWALGMIVFTLGLKIALAVFHGEMHVDPVAKEG